MEMIKSPVNGMKDILPNEMRIRSYLLDNIKKIYNRFGFEEIETPIAEHIENLLSDQGWENEKLIFKILKRGEKLEKSIESLDVKNIIDMGLRYDLTVPLCRYYSNNKDKLNNPFKSMQIGNVFRADRPQKGRFRQFVQCDIDILGEKNNIAEIDLLLATTKYLKSINFEKYNFYYEINDRRILKAIQKMCDFDDKLFEDICIILDKMDKIGDEKISIMLSELGIEKNAIDKYKNYIEQLNNAKTESEVNSIFENNIEDNVIKNLFEIINIVNKITGVKLVFNPNLVRGMGYYTGTIFEIKSPFFSGSIGGGGRYDKMVSKFINEEIAAVGISIGFERILTILMDDNFQIEDSNNKTIYSADKNIDFEQKYIMFKQAYEQRDNNETINIITTAKNKKFQRENFEKEGYKQFVDF